MRVSERPVRARKLPPAEVGRVVSLEARRTLRLTRTVRLRVGFPGEISLVRLPARAGLVWRWYELIPYGKYIVHIEDVPLRVSAREVLRTARTSHLIDHAPRRGYRIAWSELTASI